MISSRYQRGQKDRGEKQIGIYCPLGHQWIHTGRSKLDIERERRELAEARATAIADQLGAETRSHRATKGQLTKTRKRVANGVCPCCRRHFANVERHMAAKHPAYGDG